MSAGQRKGRVEECKAVNLGAGLRATCVASVLTVVVWYCSLPHLPAQEQNGSFKLKYTLEANKALRVREEEQREEAGWSARSL